MIGQLAKILAINLQWFEHSLKVTSLYYSSDYFFVETDLNNLECHKPFSRNRPPQIRYVSEVIVDLSEQIIGRLFSSKLKHLQGNRQHVFRLLLYSYTYLTVVTGYE